VSEERVHQAARGFEQAADAYERARPTYPQAAVAWLCERLAVRRGRRVLDLAAGTGKLTRSLVAAGADVVAVEPIAAMRERLPPEVEALDGTAEAIPLPGASVDAVTVAQAFHWFDAEPALAEIHRVLRPGGTLQFADIANGNPVPAAAMRDIDLWTG
jgi:ubiquinone/menaquinone biosynthesis C-methylase UbiE